MPHKLFPISTTLRRARLVIALATACSPFASPVSAQTAPVPPPPPPHHYPTNWTITIAAKKGNPPTYDLDFQPASGGCPSPNVKGPLTGPLYVCLEDTINWKTDTDYDSTTDAWIFQEDDIMDDKPSHIQHAFHSHNNNPPVKGTIDKGATVDPNVPHEYHVFVHDGHKLYHEDPKIMIGGGSPTLEQIISQLNVLLSEAKGTAEKQQIEQILDELKILDHGPSPK